MRVVTKRVFLNIFHFISRVPSSSRPCLVATLFSTLPSVPHLPCYQWSACSAENFIFCLFFLLGYTPDCCLKRKQHYVWHVFLSRHITSAASGHSATRTPPDFFSAVSIPFYTLHSHLTKKGSATLFVAGSVLHAPHITPVSTFYLYDDPRHYAYVFSICKFKKENQKRYTKNNTHKHNTNPPTLPTFFPPPPTLPQSLPVHPPSSGKLLFVLPNHHHACQTPRFTTENSSFFFISFFYPLNWHQRGFLFTDQVVSGSVNAL